jgi:hypothetical protein
MLLVFWEVIKMGKHSLYILVFMLFAALLVASSVADLMDGIIVYYSLDGNAEDSVAGKNGTEKNGATYNDHAGFGKALLLDGTSQYVEVPYDPVIDAVADGFTIAAWINPTAVDDRRPIVSREHEPDATRGFEFAIKNGSLLAFQLVNEGGANKTQVNSDFTPDVNKWTHVVGTYEPKSGAEFFVNGKSIGVVKDFTGDVGIGPTPLNIGAYLWNGYKRYFAGMIDELGIWSRVLSPAEIAALAAGDTFPFPVEPAGKLAITWGALKR